MNIEHQWMNGRDLAVAMFGRTAENSNGEWIIRGIKKANQIFASQGKEPLIFTGRLSTVARVSQWLADHPHFCASHIIRHGVEIAPSSPEMVASNPRCQRGAKIF